MFEVEFGSPAIKFLKDADKILQKRILIKIDKLKEDPFPTEAVRIVGRIEKVFRVRVGDYRLVYVVDYNQKTILIADIDKRSRVYG